MNRRIVKIQDLTLQQGYLPRRIAGLVLVGAQNEDYVAAYKELLTPEQYAAAVLNPGAPPGLESYSAVERLNVEVSAAQMRQAQVDTPLRRMPLVVLSHSRELPNPFGFPPDWPVEALERAFQDSQDKLADLVPGARHVIAARSGHYIQLDQPGAGDPRDPSGGQSGALRDARGCSYF
jgi:pimeloyl-ACP methyl ester carboxylesterase